MGDISRLRIPAIPLRSQQLLGQDHSALLREHEAKRSSLNTSIHLLVEYKSSLITAAVTGKFDVATAGSGVPA